MEKTDLQLDAEKNIFTRNRNRKFYRELGMKVRKVKKAMKVKQKKWSKPYTDSNTELTAEAEKNQENILISKKAFLEVCGRSEEKREKGNRYNC